MKKFELKYSLYGERSILIEWPKQIDESILSNIISFKNEIQIKYSKPNLQINSAYNSILITYNIFLEDYSNEILKLKKLYSQNVTEIESISKLWRIPVCYDAIFGLDLEEISIKNEIGIDNIIQLHSETVYTVYFIGFLPGFLYLGGLNEKLYVPRKEKPRSKVKKGSVAIGGKQTGIYPFESPGGWNIIGNSPVNLFNVKNEEPCFAKAGDQVRFLPISIDEYNNTKSLIELGVYQLESEAIHD